ncbi:MAG: hypothetical protein EOO10_17535 [Chitinophagaceae bacterium]|nr:MAG: hypothetical protein EOO10_17535 [Chitinophagaceae bacterium]
MSEGSFKQEIETVKTFCLKHGIAIFNGQVEDKRLGEVQWENAASTTLSDFLSVMPAVGVKILHMYIQMHDITDKSLAAVKENLEESDEEVFAIYAAHLESLSNRQGEAVALVLSFIYGGVNYLFSLHSPLWHPYALVSHYCRNVVDQVEEYFEEDDEGDDPNETGENEYPLITSRRVSQEKIQQTARKIVANEKYIHARHQKERFSLAKQFAHVEGIALSYDCTQVAYAAEDMFKGEVEALRDKVRLEKVQALLKQNPKISLRNASIALNIPERDLYKYWKK